MSYAENEMSNADVLMSKLSPPMKQAVEHVAQMQIFSLKNVLIIFWYHDKFYDLPVE